MTFMCVEKWKTILLNPEVLKTSRHLGPIGVNTSRKHDQVIGLVIDITIIFFCSVTLEYINRYLIFNIYYKLSSVMICFIVLAWAEKVGLASIFFPIYKALWYPLDSMEALGGVSQEGAGKGLNTSHSEFNIPLVTASIENASSLSVLVLLFGR